MRLDHLTFRLKRAARSIITRLILLALVLVAIGFIGRTTLLKWVLRQDVGALSAAHQLSLAQYAAQDIDDRISLRLEALRRMAPQVATLVQSTPAELAPWLALRNSELPLFSDGLMVVRANDGTVIGQSLAADIAAKDALAPDWLRAASTQNRPYIGRPLQLGDDARVVLPMAVPVKDADGKTALILTGFVTVDSANFLHLIRQRKVGETGYFLLIDPRDGLFVAATDSAKLLKPVPAPGRVALHDRAMAGFRGSDITINIDGVEELSAIASVPSAGWFLVAGMPTAEALAPVHHINALVNRNALLIAGCAIAFLLILLPRMFAPLTKAARQLHDMARGEQEIRSLPIYRDDEIGDLAKGFNFLLGVLRSKEEALQASEARMAHLAHHDSLTGLPNRIMFADRLEQMLIRAERSGGAFALLFLDLDGFKPINDTYGHEIGDSVLCRIARILQETLRKSDTIARMGGDEFAVLLTELEECHGDSRLIAEKCAQAVGDTITIDDTEVSLGLSVGVACYPENGTTADDLLRHADHDMYRAKSRRKANNSARRTVISNWPPPEWPPGR